MLVTIDEYMDEKILEVYYDHYKDTFSFLRDYIKERDRYFLYTLIILFIILFQVNNQIVIKDIVQHYVSSDLGSNASIDFNYINSLVLFVFLSVIVRYFQSNILIQRQYAYIHLVEEKLTAYIQESNCSITREGKSYLDGYPKVSYFIHRIYTVVFPVLLCIVLMIKIYDESLNDNKAFRIINFLICFTTFSITVLYVSWIHFGDFKKESKYFNNLKGIIKKIPINKILKRRNKVP